MQKILKNILLVAVLFSLTGCAAVMIMERSGSRSVDADYTLAKAEQENKGLLIVATRFTLRCKAVDILGLGVGSGKPGSLFSSTWPYGMLHLTNGKETAKFYAYTPAESGFRPADYRSPPGFFHVLKLEPGEYYFDQAIGQQDMYSYVTDKIASLPFSIEKGKATYVGEISIAMTECDYSGMQDDGNEDEFADNKKKKPIKKEVNAAYRVSNQWNRDVHILKERFKNIKPSQVKLMITHI